MPAKTEGVQHTNKWARIYERICTQCVDITSQYVRCNNANC